MRYLCQRGDELLRFHGCSGSLFGVWRQGGGRRLRYVAGEEEEDVAFFVGLHAQKRARLPPVMFEFKTTPPPLSLHLTDARSRKR